MNYKFNIVTPSYNQDKFLIKTIISVLKQRGNFKINYFVMDGGSTDESKKVLNLFKNKIDFESKKDRGQSHAINKGIKKIKLKPPSKKYSEIFAYINSDDYYLPAAFAKVQKAFERNPEKMWLIGDCKIVDVKGKETQILVKLYKKILRILPIAWTLPILNSIAQPAVFIRGQVFKEIGLFNEGLNFVMDYEYWFRIINKFGEPIKLNQDLAAFRIHSLSKGGSQYQRQFAEELKVATKFSKSPLLLALHKWHNNMITTIYQLIK